MMKFTRIIAAALILLLATMPALAAACAASCAMSTVAIGTAPMATVPMATGDDNPATMAADHCHHTAPEKSQHQPQADGKGCGMATGCHYSQAAPLLPSVHVPAVSLTTTALPRFVPSEACADLPPPLKPPA